MATADLGTGPGQSGARRGPSSLGRRGSSPSGLRWRSMRAVTTRPVATLALAAVVAGALAAGCASAAASPAPTAVAVAPSAAASPEPSTAPAPHSRRSPAGSRTDPGPVGTLIPTTQTDWGEILDDLPASFPLFPGADVAEVPDEVVSGSFEAPADAGRAGRLVHGHVHRARLCHRHRHGARGRHAG